MTDRRDPDELIEIASAFIDGEATVEESELVTTDPDLQRVVAALEANRALVADEPVDLVDPPERAAHIAAAMSAFDELHPPTAAPRPVAAFEPPRPAPPQDLSAIAAAVTGRRGPASSASNSSLDAATDAPDADSSGSDDQPIDLAAQRARRRKSPPAWLSAAAGLVIVAGGAAYVVGQGEGSDAETATERVSASATSDDSADDAATDTADGGEAEMFQADEATEESSEATEAEESAEESAEDAAGSTMAEGDEDVDEEAALEPLVPPVDPESAYLVEAGTSVEEIVETYADEALDIAFSYCYSSGALDGLVEEQAPARLTGMIPVSIGDELFEVLLFTEGDRTYGVARTADCADPLG